MEDEAGTRRTLAKRIGHLEADFKGLEVKVSSGFDAIGRTLEAQSQDIRDISHSIAESNSKTFNWGWFIGAVGLMVTVGSQALVPVKANIIKSETAILSMQTDRWTEKDHNQYTYDKRLSDNRRDADILQIVTLNDEILRRDIQSLERRFERLPHIFESYEEKYKSNEGKK